MQRRREGRARTAQRIVMKFGGTSVGDGDAIGQVAEILAAHRRSGTEVVAVVSAMAGVTDALTRGATRAAAGETEGHRQIARETLALARRAAEKAINATELRAAILRRAEQTLDGYVSVCDSIRVLGEATERALDLATSCGEPIAADLVAGALSERGCEASSVDPRSVILTDDEFQNAAPLIAETIERCERYLLPMIGGGGVPVVGGFIGSTVEGATTTLGRGGSDFSASILGRALEADEVWIWTDVDGVMTADPRLVPEAHVIPILSFSEIGELAYFGAKVLHPRTIRPLVDEAIPLRIKNTFRPQLPGTLIRAEADPIPGAIKAVTNVQGLTMMTVEGRGMLGVPGIAARTFDAVARCRANVLMISQASSEQSICFVIPRQDVDCVRRQLEDEFALQLSRREIDRIGDMEEIAVVTVMGTGMRGVAGVAGRLFGALAGAGINIIAIAQGSSECSISIVVRAEDQTTAVRAIHQGVIER
jgi:aspartokinase/homoserine dehydrogenase 1